jgi:hypothetical protein
LRPRGAANVESGLEHRFIKASPPKSQSLVRLRQPRAVERHLPRHQFNVLKVAEASERTLIRQLVAGLETVQ